MSFTKDVKLCFEIHLCFDLESPNNSQPKQPETQSAKAVPCSKVITKDARSRSASFPASRNPRDNFSSSALGTRIRTSTPTDVGKVNRLSSLTTEATLFGALPPLGPGNSAESNQPAAEKPYRKTAASSAPACVIPKTGQHQAIIRMSTPPQSWVGKSSANQGRKSAEADQSLPAKAQPSASSPASTRPTKTPKETNSKAVVGRYASNRASAQVGAAGSRVSANSPTAGKLKTGFGFSNHAMHELGHSVPAFLSRPAQEMSAEPVFNSATEPARPKTPKGTARSVQSSAEYRTPRVTAVGDEESESLGFEVQENDMTKLRLSYESNDETKAAQVGPLPGSEIDYISESANMAEETSEESNNDASEQLSPQEKYEFYVLCMLGWARSTLGLAGSETALEMQEMLAPEHINALKLEIELELIRLVSESSLQRKRTESEILSTKLEFRALQQRIEKFSAKRTLQRFGCTSSSTGSETALKIKEKLTPQQLRSAAWTLELQSWLLLRVSFVETTDVDNLFIYYTNQTSHESMFKWVRCHLCLTGREPLLVP